jgi:cellulose synthase/poly-beta-1,6-N-acetylglucosamine synthase-like glycosyltransferase
MKYSAVILLDDKSQNQFDDLVTTISSCKEGFDKTFIVTTENLQEKACNLLESLTSSCCGKTGGEEIVAETKVKYADNIFWVSNKNKIAAITDALKLVDGDLTLISLSGTNISTEFTEKTAKSFKDDAVGLVYTDYCSGEDAAFQIKYLPYFHPMISSPFNIKCIAVRNSKLSPEDINSEDLFQSLIKFMNKSIIIHLAYPLYKI